MHLAFSTWGCKDYGFCGFPGFVPLNPKPKTLNPKPVRFQQSLLGKSKAELIPGLVVVLYWLRAPVRAQLGSRV